jgi:hypothetical protein
MAKCTVTISVMVSVEVPDEFAAKVTRSDLAQMARAACPDSLTLPPHGPPNGTQVLVDDVAQEDERGHPIFADLFVEHDICNEPEFEFEDDFATAESEPRP